MHNIEDNHTLTGITKMLFRESNDLGELSTGSEH